MLNTNFSVIPEINPGFPSPPSTNVKHELSNLAGTDPDYTAPQDGQSYLDVYFDSVVGADMHIELTGDIVLHQDNFIT